MDSFSGSRRWVSYGSQDTLQNLWDSTVGNCTSDQSTFKYPDASHQGEPGYLSSIRDRESQGPDGEEGDGFLESKSDINFNAPIYVEEECAVGGQAKSLFALASAPPTRTSFDFEEQVRQTAAFEAAAFAALKTPYLVRNSSSNDASSQSPPPTLVLSSAASLTSLFAPIGDESVPPSPNKSPTSDKRPERVMLRRPAVLVPTTSSAPGPAALTRTIQLTAQETVKEDQLNAYLRWLQIQHSGSEGNFM